MPHIPYGSPDTYALDFVEKETCLPLKDSHAPENEPLAVSSKINLILTMIEVIFKDFLKNPLFRPF